MRMRIIFTTVFAIMMFAVMTSAQTTATSGRAFATLTVGGAGSLYRSQLPVIDVVAGQPIRVALGDVNGDGRADIIVGAEVNGHVKSSTVDNDRFADIITGSSAIPHVKTAPTRRQGGNANGDGFDDVIVGAGSGAIGGHVKSSPTRRPVGDVTGDGFADVITGTLSGVAHVKTTPIPCTDLATTSVRNAGSGNLQNFTKVMLRSLPTESSWKNTCRLLTVELRDGTKYFGTVRFQSADH